MLSAAPGVADCVAVVRDDLGGKAARMVGHVVPDDPPTFDLDQVKRHAADTLPDHMVPTHWSVVPALPLTPKWQA